METAVLDSTATEMFSTLRRAALYRALARGFSYPRVESWDETVQVWTDLNHSHPDWPATAPALVAAACQHLTRITQSEVEPEYFRLFGPAAVATLHETAYGEPGRLMAKPAHLSDISGFYLAFGLAPRSGGDTNLEDHLTMELEFMSLLNAKEAMASDEGWEEHLQTTRQAQASFIKDHLGIWIGLWRQKLLDNNPTPFYATIAELLANLVEADATRLGVAPVQLKQKAEDKMMGGEELICPKAEFPE